MDPPVDLEETFVEGSLQAQMPVEVWSHRFYRQTATDGVAMQLVRPTSAS